MNIRRAAYALARRDGYTPIEEYSEWVQKILGGNPAGASYNLVRVALDGSVAGVQMIANYEETVRLVLREAVG